MGMTKELAIEMSDHKQMWKYNKRNDCIKVHE